MKKMVFWLNLVFLFLGLSSIYSETSPHGYETEINLKAGWNLVTIPIDSEKPVDEVLANSLYNVQGQPVQSGQLLHRIWGFDGTWQSWTPNSGGTLSSLKPNHGYWLYASAPGKMKLNFSVQPAVAIQKTGWALIGFNLSDGENLSITEELLSDTAIAEPHKPENLSRIWGFDGQWASFSFTGGNLQTVEPGRGYWFYLQDITGEAHISRETPFTINPFNQNSPVALVIGGSTTLQPPAFATIRPSAGKKDSSGNDDKATNTMPSADSGETFTCDEAGRGKIAGYVNAYSFAGERLNSEKSSPVFCPEIISPAEPLAWNLRFSARELENLRKKPELAENMVVSVDLFSGQQQKTMLKKEVRDAIRDENPKVNEIALNTDTDLVVNLLAAEAARRLGVAKEKLLIGTDKEEEGFTREELKNLLHHANPNGFDPAALAEIIAKSAEMPAFAALRSALAELNSPEKVVITEKGAVNKGAEAARLMGGVETLSGVKPPKAALGAVLESVQTVAEMLDNSRKKKNDDKFSDLLKMAEELLSRDDFNAEELRSGYIVSLAAEFALACANDSYLRDMALNIFEKVLAEAKVKENGNNTEKSARKALVLAGMVLDVPSDLFPQLAKNVKASAPFAAACGSAHSLFAEMNSGFAKSEPETARRVAGVDTILKSLLFYSKSEDDMAEVLAEAIAAASRHGVDSTETLINKLSGYLMENLVPVAKKLVYKTHDLVSIARALIFQAKSTEEALEIIGQFSDVLGREMLSKILADGWIDVIFDTESRIIASAGREGAFRINDSLATVKLDAGSSVDPLHQELEYQWYMWQNDQKIQLTSGFSVNNVGLTTTVANVADDSFITFEVEVRSISIPDRKSAARVNKRFFTERPPVIVAPLFISVEVGAQFTANASDSYSPSGLPLRFFWDFNGETYTEPAPEIRLTMVEEFTATLRVEALDSENGQAVATAVQSILVQVNPLIPVPEVPEEDTVEDSEPADEENIVIGENEPAEGESAGTEGSENVSEPTENPETDGMAEEGAEEENAEETGDDYVVYTPAPTAVTLMVGNSVLGGGLTVYPYTAEGTYLGYSRKTGADGTVVFSLEPGNYKFRYQYEGVHFYSEPLAAGSNGTLQIPAPTVVSVRIGAESLGAGLTVYPYAEDGTYLGYTKRTGVDGKVSFNLSDGQYKFRYRHDGVQFYSELITAGTEGVLEIPAPTAITLLVGDETLGAGLTVYPYNAEGDYLGYTKKTNADGAAAFNLYPGQYKFRYAYNGVQFYSEMVNAGSSGVLRIPAPTVVSLRLGSTTLGEGLTVYPYTESGDYVGYTKKTDAEGRAYFNLMAGNYTFRYRHDGVQYYSGLIAAGTEGALEIPVATAVSLFLGSDALGAGLSIYPYDEDGNYVGYTKKTDENGVAYFNLPSGNYRFRHTYNGVQFYSGLIASGDGGVLEIPLPTIVSLRLGDSSLGEGLSIYPYLESGDYVGYIKKTDADGRAYFNLAEGNYTFRYRHDGVQYYSDLIAAGTEGVLEIPAITQLCLRVGTVNMGGGLSVYPYDEAGNYVGYTKKTAENGCASFNLSSGNYRFRHTYNGVQFYSGLLSAGAAGNLDIPAPTTVSLTLGGEVLGEGLTVYPYRADGTYAGYTKKTDAAGLVYFNLEDGDYSFRYRHDGVFFHSDLIAAGQEGNLNVPAPTIVTLQVGGAPLGEGLSVYPYDMDDNYLGYVKRTAANGSAAFNLPEGSYKFRHTYNGAHFYASGVVSGSSGIIDIPAPTKIVLLMGEVNLGEGLTVYPYTVDGTYIGYTRKTDENGAAFFNLAEGAYKFRYSHDGVQFYSDLINSGDSGVLQVPAPTAVTVMLGYKPLGVSQTIYPYTAEGEYAGYTKKTNEYGTALFNLSEGNYKFRLTYDGVQYFSPVISAGSSCSIAIPDPSVNAEDMMLWEHDAFGAIYSTPVEGPDGIVYVGSNDGRLLALHDDGSEKWTFRTGAPIYSSVAVGNNGALAFGSFDRHLYVLNMDGSLRWKFAADHFIRTSPVFGEEGEVYFGSLDGSFYALDNAGELIWKFNTGSPISSSPVIGSQGNIYFGANNGLLYALSKSGEQLWTFASGGPIFAAPAIRGNLVAFGSYDRKLYILDNQGNFLSSFATEGVIRTSPVIDENDVIMFGSEDFKLYAVEKIGNNRWFFRTDGGISSYSIVKTRDSVWAGSNDGGVYALSLEGLPKHRYRVDDRGVLTVGGSSKREAIYVGTKNGTVMALRTDDQAVSETPEATVVSSVATELLNNARPAAPWISDFRAGHHSLHLFWQSADENIDSYRVYISRESWDPRRAEVVLTEQSDLRFEDLEAHIEHCVAITALNGSGESEFSAPLCVYPLDFGISGDLDSSGSIALSSEEEEMLGLPEPEFSSALGEKFHSILQEFIVYTGPGAGEYKLELSMINFGPEAEVDGHTVYTAPAQQLDGTVELKAGEALLMKGSLWFRAWDGSAAFMNQIEGDGEQGLIEVPISIRAPEKPGTYFLVFVADNAEEPEYLFSATAPGSPSGPVWADGNDLNELDFHYWIYARKNGWTPVFRLESGGHYAPVGIGAAVLTIKVVAPE